MTRSHLCEQLEDGLLYAFCVGLLRFEVNAQPLQLVLNAFNFEQTSRRSCQRRHLTLGGGVPGNLCTFHV